MQKKKIRKEDLELNYDVIGYFNAANGLDFGEIERGAATNNTCASNLATCNTCGGTLEKCDTTTTSIAACQTAENGDGCDTDLTLICKTVTCVNSISYAEQCCVATRQEGCKNTFICISQETCGNTNDICLETQYEGCQKPGNTLTDCNLCISDNCAIGPTL